MLILFVCSGNLCRSPFAEAWLRAWLGENGADATVSSAGILTQGRSSPPEFIDAARRAGVDLSAHRSSYMEVVDLEKADLVIGMGREHVREAVATSPAVWPRCFTLKEFVRRGRAIGSRTPEQPMEAWLAVLHQGRKTADLLGSASEDDVFDPMHGNSDPDFQACVSQLARLVNELAILLWPTRNGRITQALGT
jgi:protein-tyrosine phosphatase